MKPRSEPQLADRQPYLGAKLPTTLLPVELSNVQFGYPSGIPGLFSNAGPWPNVAGAASTLTAMQ